jgi:hypothetical protein
MRAGLGHGEWALQLFQSSVSNRERRCWCPAAAGHWRGGISMPFGERSFGRRYVVQWDDEAARYHVTLGKESIGFHKTPEGAGLLARAHALQVSVSGQGAPHRVIFAERGVNGQASRRLNSRSGTP